MSVSFVLSDCIALENPLPGQEEVGFQFFISSTAQSFEDGRELCQAEVSGGESASIHSNSENEIALDLLEKATGDEIDGAFIGLFDESFDDATEIFSTKRFDWVDQTDFDFGVTAGKTPWQDDQPNNSGDKQQDCVAILKEKGWNDKRCRNKLPVICRSACSLSNDSNNINFFNTTTYVSVGAILGLSAIFLITVLVAKQRRKQLHYLPELNNAPRRTAVPSGLPLSGRHWNGMVRRFSIASTNVPPLFKRNQNSPTQATPTTAKTSPKPTFRGRIGKFLHTLSSRKKRANPKPIPQLNAVTQLATPVVNPLPLEKSKRRRRKKKVKVKRTTKRQTGDAEVWGDWGSQLHLRMETSAGNEQNGNRAQQFPGTFPAGPAPPGNIYDQP